MESEAQQLVEASIEVTVIRADGTREDKGVVSYWHVSPWKRLLWRLRGGK